MSRAASVRRACDSCLLLLCCSFLLPAAAPSTWRPSPLPRPLGANRNRWRSYRRRMPRRRILLGRRRASVDASPRALVRLLSARPRRRPLPSRRRPRSPVLRSRARRSLSRRSLSRRSLSRRSLRSPCPRGHPLKSPGVGIPSGSHAPNPGGRIRSRRVRRMPRSDVTARPSPARAKPQPASRSRRSTRSIFARSVDASRFST
jgi:hypothetical protein